MAVERKPRQRRAFSGSRVTSHCAARMRSKGSRGRLTTNRRLGRSAEKLRHAAKKAGCPDAGAPTLPQLFGYYRPQAQPTIRIAFEAALQEGQSFDVELELLTANQRPSA